VLRLLVTPRWIGWTLFALVAVAVCAGMAYWQLLRAESPTGSLLNAGYAFQWPLFGVFFAALWWRMLRAEARALAEMRADEPAPRTAGPEPVRAVAGDSPFGPRPAGAVVADDDDALAPERARWNLMYAELAARDQTPSEETDPS
jgi:DNA-binding transcriptional regulator of glucitol operon